MKSPQRLQLQLLGAIVATLLTTLTASAQAREESGFWTSIDGVRVLTEVIPVRGADPNELADLLGAFFGEENDDPQDPFDAFVIDSTRALLVRCNPDKMKEVRIALKKLDIPAITPRETTTAIVKCSNRRADELAESAKVQLTKMGKIAVDNARNTIVVRDTAQRVDAIRDLVTALDRPTAKMTVEFHILGPDGAPLENGGLGASLQRELDELGLKGYGIVSHTMVRTIEGDEFYITEDNAYRELSIQGKVKVNENSRDADLEFSLNIEQKQAENRSRVQLRTSLRAPLGDRSIVGIAPTGEDGSRPLVLVARSQSQ
ncbi:MAG: secretin N-terminal domain-containing protein [Planctomycetota bacterium]